MNTLVLPPLSPVPDDITDHLQHFLQTPAHPALEDWLTELLRESNHIATTDVLRWRVLVMVWLASEFGVETSWQYLMWFNMNQPTISDQVAELLTEAVDEFGCHLQLAHWIAHARDERLKTFFSGYKNIPAVRQLPPLMDWLFAHPYDDRTGTFLAGFCRDTADHPSPALRGWRVLAAIWVAANFNAADGLTFLREFLADDGALSAEDYEKLGAILREEHRFDTVRQWATESPDVAARQALRLVLRPDVSAWLADALAAPADFPAPGELSARATADAAAHRTLLALLAQAGIELDRAHLLDVGGGWLSPHAALFGGQNVRITGVSADVPPAFLPVAGVKQKFRRAQLKGAWKAATAEYYHVLAAQSGIKPKWKTVTVIPADPTDIPLPDGAVDAAVCCDFLPHLPDVSGSLAEIARTLVHGGVFIAEIVPFTALDGAHAVDVAAAPWAHLRDDAGHSVGGDGRWLNRWRLSQYQAALVENFEIVHWQIEKDDRAAQLLSPKFAALLEHYAPEELSAARVWVIARKK